MSPELADFVAEIIDGIREQWFGCPDAIRCGGGR
jgi:hypothetical protein